MGKETISRKAFAKGVAAGVVVAASLGILTIGEYTVGGGGSPADTGPASAAPEEASSDALPATEAPTADSPAAEATGSGSYTPGTYTASARGLESDITVTVTFDESSITEITADVSGETAGIGAEIGEPMIQKALAAQSAGIDGVAGATISSDAFKAALADCIAQAGGDSTPSDETAVAETETASGTPAAETETASGTPVTEAEVEVETVSGTPAAETESASDVPAPETETASGTPMAEAEGDSSAESEPAESSSSAETAPEEQIAYMEPSSYETVSVSPEGPFLAGTYTAAAEGISGEVLVTMTFDETSVLSVDADVSKESSGRGRLIDSEMEKRILAAQTSEVDGVSGATVTSDAILSAAADCIAQAKSAATAEDAGTEATTEGGAPSDEAAGAEAETASETSQTENVQSEDAQTEDAQAIAVIGGTDGPTSIFLAGKIPAEEITYMEPETYETVSESPEAPFAAGTFTSTAPGISGDVTVTMTFDESAILSMDVDVSGEPHGRGSLIDTEIVKRILAAQTSEVDGISGATVTSDAILSAAADCIAQAKSAATADDAGTEATTEGATPAEDESETATEAESELLTPAELAAAED